ncbi:MAG: hypothetical protein LH613_12505 [Chamaesiphon sp.]|nr:hypothetical protein [Chamaesiphon sp.]
MTKRSIQASPVGVRQAKRAFALKGWTQENLAGEVNLKTRQPIWRFFTEQPVDRQIFMEICTILDLNWREIALNPPMEFPDRGKLPDIVTLDIKDLAQQMRSHRWTMIQTHYSSLQTLEQSLCSINDSRWIEVLLLMTTILHITDALVRSIEHQMDAASYSEQGENGQYGNGGNG